MYNRSGYKWDFGTVVENFPINDTYSNIKSLVKTQMYT